MVSAFLVGPGLGPCRYALCARLPTWSVHPDPRGICITLSKNWNPSLSSCFSCDLPMAHLKVGLFCMVTTNTKHSHVETDHVSQYL